MHALDLQWNPNCYWPLLQTDVSRGVQSVFFLPPYEWLAYVWINRVCVCTWYNWIINTRACISSNQSAELCSDPNCVCVWTPGKKKKQFHLWPRPTSCYSLLKCQHLFFSSPLFFSLSHLFFYVPSQDTVEPVWGREWKRWAQFWANWVTACFLNMHLNIPLFPFISPPSISPSPISLKS